MSDDSNKDGSAEEPDGGPDDATEDTSTTAADSETAADDAEETQTVEEDDFVTVAYTARTVEGGQLVDTTDPEVAEEADIDADQEFEPRTIVLGQGHIFPAVEDTIIGSAVGDTGSAVVPASEAFGEYDDDEVRTISSDRIPEDDRYPGAQVQVDGDEGFVETIIGGRARVDFNHPLAGADIEYEYEVVETVEDRMEQADGLLQMMLDIDLEMRFETDTVEEQQLIESDEDEDEDGNEETADTDAEPDPKFETIETEKESLYIEATPQLTMNQQWMMQKQQLGQQLIDLLGIDRIVVEEVIDGGMGMGMPGMMGGGAGGGGGLEDALEEADIDADELAEEL
ncbi:MAG: FKBP-type peptidyl-prolyl cis-trans isomerases 2 [halophilic archaeon J07HX5]|nr:MAG: FKBP-type peptidyl-prolyl cis-trans isomerases 2 [halophilic archaeon J07HX5]